MEDKAHRLKRTQLDVFKPAVPASPIVDARKPALDAHLPTGPAAPPLGPAPGPFKPAGAPAPARGQLREEAMAAIDAILATHGDGMDLTMLIKSSLEKVEADKQGAPSPAEDEEAARLRFFSGEEEEEPKKPTKYDWFGMEANEDEQ